MNISHSVPSTVSSASFSFLSTEDIRRISVKQIVNPTLLDDLNRPNVGGLYDAALGPSDPRDICKTCRLTYFTCPGHFGHIELPSPVYHPLFMVKTFGLLRATCLFCHRFKMSRLMILKYIAKLRLLECGLLEAASAVDDMHIRIKSKVEGEDDEDVADESLAEFEKRLNLFVYFHLRSDPESRRDRYKDGQVFQARKHIIAEFLKVSMSKKCQNDSCYAHGYTFRKEGHTKIIEYDLTLKQKEQHSLLGLKRSNVLAQDSGFSRISSLGVRQQPTAGGSDSESVISESDGESTRSRGQDEEVTEHHTHQIPKAANGKEKSSRGRNERVVPPEETRAHLRRLFKNESVACSLLFGRHGPFAPLSVNGLSISSADVFFMDVLLVSPTRVRPPAKLGDTLFEHPQNELLARVLSTSYRIRDLNLELKMASQKKPDSEPSLIHNITASLLEALIQLQVDVNSFIDTGKNPQVVRQGKLPPAGVKQGLEKKEGLFRMNMMGKRVNYSARSVISPDVNIEPNEVGVPPVFAQKLTFPEPVNTHNIHEMRQLVINGPSVYPGASMVEFEDGTLHHLDKLAVDRRKAIANQLLTPQSGTHGVTMSKGLETRTQSINKKVYRHLRDGDILILNRQPTLHKPSMMAHKARVLLGEKTIRMHYANCNSYNADFDGDEMNIHFPQNQVARAEASFIANTDNQYLVPTSGKPLRGLIQDHVVAGVYMTSRDTFFSRAEYQQLLYGALRPEEDPSCRRLRTIPPVIWKPKPLWSGKQVISTILLNLTPSNAEGLNLDSKAKVAGELWGKGSEEAQVIFFDGELLCGVLDKSQFGASDYGLVHSVYELYGADIAGKLLGCLSRLFTKYLQSRAFTCRMDDLALTPEGDARRTEIIRKNSKLGTEGAIENFPSLSQYPLSERQHMLTSFLRDVLRDDQKMAGLDVTVKKKLANFTKEIREATLPHGLLRPFPFNHMQMMTQSGAKGSVVNAQQISCALGQQELEGRRVPVMVSGKTLPSFKAFETQAIAGGYVASRFLTGIKPQEFYFHCMAGREGLIDTAVKTSRSGYLQRCLIKHLESIRVHYDHTVRGGDSSIYQFHYGGDALDVTKQKHLYQFKFTARNELSLLNRYQPKRIAGVVDDQTAMEYMKKNLKKLRKDPSNAESPALSKFSPSRFLGSTSEKFASKVEEYIKSNPDDLLKSKKPSMLKYSSRHSLIPSSRFRLLMNVRYMRSLIDAGEAVGLLAAQGVGEPSTQMTLNTFHFAGHGAANVTLGIPRLREIVMTASAKPKTPSMTLIVRPDIASSLTQAFCKRASQLTISQIVDKVVVRETLLPTKRRQSEVDITFYPEDEYKKEYDLKLEEIETSFIRFSFILKKELQVEFKRMSVDLKTQIAELGKGRTEKRDAEREEEDDEAEPPAQRDDASEIGDGDADHEKRVRQSKQQTTYESDDEDQEEMNEQNIEATIEATYREEAMEVDGEAGEAIKTTRKSLDLESAFMKNLSAITSVSFSNSGLSFALEFGSDVPKLLLVDIIERACKKAVIREIPGIIDCFESKDSDKDKKTKIVTNGSNLTGIWEFCSSFPHEIVELNTIYSNDIYATLQTYGVEMARAIILQEVGNVFGAYNIDVDARHLELIADYMTFDGGYKPFNRSGISTSSSPFLKASYETTGAFLSDATLDGDYDDLTTPSSRIVIGRPNLSGTGSFDIVQPVEQSLASQTLF